MNAFPFDSKITGYDEAGIPIYDRASSAEEFARLIAAFLSDGVFGEAMCQALADTGMSVRIGQGNCLIRGRYGYIPHSESLTLEPGGENPRIDTIVLRLDLRPDVRNIVPAVLKGKEAINPTPPVLTRDATVWELGIANIAIGANVKAIAQENITDTRLDTDRCGIVAAINSKVDTTGLYEQINADLSGFKAVQEAGFLAWFEKIQSQLSGDVAANLALQISQKAEAKTATIKLTAAGWSGSGPYTQAVSVNEVTAGNAVVVSPAPESFTDWGESGVYASAQAEGELTFMAENKPDAELAANVLCIT